MWTPLLAPVSSGVGAPPWAPAENALAGVVVDRFVVHLSWLPHSTYLPPGAETVESLLWGYFAGKLMAPLPKTGASHVLPIYVRAVSL